MVWKKEKKLNNIDKIRILWIEDEVTQNRTLFKDLEPYFEVPYKNINNENEPIKCINEYCKLLSENIIFPVEIISADYDLSLCTLSEIYDLWGTMEPNTDINFAGFLIQTVHALHFKSHPTGIVSATQKGAEMPKSFEHINDMLKKIYNADINLSRKDKSWRMICENGVRSLRRNIERLYKSGEIEIFIDDLMFLSQKNNKHNKLTITSPFAIRRLPVQGLFIDEEKGETRNNAIHNWANKLYFFTAFGRTIDEKEEKTHNPHNFFLKAEKISKEIWTAYNDDKLLNKRCELSKLVKKKEETGNHLTFVEEKRLQQLKGEQEFNVKKDNCLNYVDIRNVLEVPNKEKPIARALCRWVVIHLIKRLIEQCLKLRLQMYGVDSPDNKEIPSISIADICLLLFPVPKNPLTLPWDNQENPFDLGKGWGKFLATNLTNSPGTGDYRMHLMHILDGQGWDGTNNKLGWKAFERGWIREKLMKFLIQENLCSKKKDAEKVLFRYPITRRIIYNK